MKKKLLVVCCLVLAAAMLSGCTMLADTLTRTRAMNARAEQTGSEATGSSGGETVTISKAEYEQLQQFSELTELLNAAGMYFYEDFDKDKLIEYAAKGLMAGLGDPYSFYYNPEEFAQLWEDDKGQYTGIGVLISANYQTQKCTISRVFDGSPAKEVGVLRGDQLYKVGEDLIVTADNLQDAVDIMRGVAGTDVDVTFLRNGEEITYTITRREINVNQVESTMLTDEIGYIAFYQFAGTCEQEFEAALNQLTGQGAKGIIIDLRDNPGGWVDQANYVADLFMDEGESCYLVYRDGIEDHSQYLTQDGKTDVKLVILVNENSASSSEILTGALRDRADATVVGVTSFGKGIIQGVWGVGQKGAGVQMTVAQYMTPNGNAVHEVGITPDVEIKLAEGDNGMYEFADVENDPQLRKALEVMKDKLK